MPHAAPLEAARVRVVALGDSTTAGTPGFRSPLEAPPAGSGNPESQYGYWIEKKHPEWKILNRGVNGETSGRILARFERDVLAAKPRALVVLAGVNDLYQGLAEEILRRNLDAIYEKAARAGIPVVACSILPYNIETSEVRQKMNRMNDWIRAEAASRGMVFCDTARAVEGSPGMLAGTPDGLHPDVSGYRKMGEVITPALEQILKSRKRAKRP